MKSERHYLKEYNFLLSRHPRVIDDKCFMDHVLELNNELGDDTDLKEFTDARQVEDVTKLTVSGMINGAKLEVPRADSLLAILINDSPLHFGMVRAYQTFAEGNRKEVKIFTDISEAIAWLGYDEEDAAVLKKFVNDICRNPLDN